ncbi:HNH endonuclease [Nocardioides marmoriginsengisoli]|uniref:HNH endonuclease n=2 Tax=Nocardioides marmoriginsengisoli TaxID=661483 RepID=A0A3N0CS36_9ACTN|nr:HNH endonuclease [Nocardioides marmoriginsengisoli]
MPCAEHKPKPWAGSNRRATLPPWWNSLAKRMLDRDPVCKLRYPGEWHTNKGWVSCTIASTEVDHIGSNEDHSPKNLRGVCSNCHRRRTQEQANAGRVP